MDRIFVKYYARSGIHNGVRETFLHLVFLLGLSRLALSIILAPSAFQILPSSPQILHKSWANFVNGSISGLNGTISSPFVFGLPTNTDSTTVSDDQYGWPEGPFALPMWDIMGGKLLFTRIQRRCVGGSSRYVHCTPHSFDIMLSE